MSMPTSSDTAAEPNHGSPSGEAARDSTTVAAPSEPSEPSEPRESMDPALTTIQPGGGVVMTIELAWGRLRRLYLRTFRRGFVRRMAQSRRGTRGSLPFEAIDPRDVKYYRNQQTYRWSNSDDPFAWRDSLPFVRVGLAELVLIGGGFLLVAAVAGWFWWPLSLPFVVLAGLVVWFFRDPTRRVPDGPGTIVAPADGKLVQIDRIEDPELGSCVQFGIFLSIFNVHANRASLPGRVIAVRYKPGKFLNALRPESAQENENLDVILASGETGDRNYRIRQITGQFARRIVCWVRPGDELGRGEMFGMIKLGSRTELIVPHSDALEITASIGDKICAGSTVLARYQDPQAAETDGLPNAATGSSEHVDASPESEDSL
jgi:phosphatidylserine decarboxylase